MMLFVLHLAVGQAEPVKYAFKRYRPGVDLRMEQRLHAAARRCPGARPGHNGLLKPAAAGWAMLVAKSSP